MANDCSIGNRLFVVNGVNALTYNATSDYRIKNNIVNLNEKFTVDNLKPIQYCNILSNKTDIGFLAHEVQEHFPYLVDGVKDGPGTQSINYNGFIGILVKEIQVLKKEMSLLKTNAETDRSIINALIIIFFSFMLSFISIDK